jgi:outer membrane protein TolC
MNALPLLMMFAALALGGCAGFSKDGGFDTVAQAARSQLGKDLQWPRSEAEQAGLQREVAELLARPLSADDAVQIALLNNRDLRASFEELGISEADLVQSGRLPNPRFDLRHAGAAGQYDIEETLSFNLLSMLTMPSVHDIEKGRFAQRQFLVILHVMQLAAETRQAYFAAVAAQQSVDYLRQVHAAAETSAALARGMIEAGNWNRLDQTREQVFYADAVARLARAKLAQGAALEALIRLLGLPSQQSADWPPLRLAQQLPELPPSVEDLPDVEAAILQDRIDLRLLRMQVDELRHRLKLTKATRFVNVLDAGPTRVQQGTREAPYEGGYAVSLEVPIFDSGEARVRKSEASYARSVDRFAQAAIDARSEIRRAYEDYRTRFELARQQRDQMLPLRKAVAEQDLLRYNASLISIFELLADARDQASGVSGYIESVRDFWIAKSQFDCALLGDCSPAPASH